MTKRTEQRILDAARMIVRNMRDTANRLDAAIEADDWQTISESQISQTSWTLDAIRGAAWAVLQARGAQ